MYSFPLTVDRPRIAMLVAIAQSQRNTNRRLAVSRRAAKRIRRTFCPRRRPGRSGGCRCPPRCAASARRRTAPSFTIVTEPAGPTTSHGDAPTTGKVCVRQIAIRIVLVGDREVEFAVFEHLGPDAAVDAAAQVLDELTVDERVDRRAGLGRVDRDFDRGVRCGCGGRLGGNASRRTQEA